MCSKEDWPYYDPLFSVLHLWAHCRDLKRPVCSGTEQTAGQDANNPPGCNDSGLSRDLDLYLIHVADLSPGKLGAAKDVLGEGTLATSFP